MGMPPREPTEEMMQQVRKGQKLSSFIKYATIVKATDLTTTSYQGVQINGRRSSGDRTGEDVVIKLLIWPKAALPEASLYQEAGHVWLRVPNPSARI
jgi:hypothetical protein